MKTVNVTLFIVPNAACRFDGCGNGPASFKFNSYELSCFCEMDKKCNIYGITSLGETNISTRWVQICVGDSGDDDATNHGWSIEGMPTRTAPGDVPESFVRRILDEGEVTTTVRRDSDGKDLEEPIEIHWIYKEPNKYSHIGSGKLLLDLVIERCDRYTTQDVKDTFKAYMDALEERNKR